MDRIVIAKTGGHGGVAFQVPVIVDWPELRLTEEQVIANAIALANFKPQPYEDNSIFIVEIPA